MTKCRVFFLIVPFVLICLSGSTLLAQDLEKIGNKEADPVTVSGGFSFNQIMYTASGIENRRDPYSYFLTGNLTFDLYGWSVPFSFSFSNQNVSFRQPFNQYGLTPTYKWIKLYAGYNSMNFSQYTLSGHIFNGFGAELTPPGKFRYSVMYGRLQKPIKADSLSMYPPAYKRMGFGMKVGYHNEKDYIDLVVFKAKDDSASIVRPSLEDGITPEDNMVLSISGGKSLFDKVMVTAELAGSAITHDQAASEMDPGRKAHDFYGLFKYRQSSAFYKAFNTRITYNAGILSVGIGYERIDPGYKTLGGYYFNNDLENITFNISTMLFRKVSMAANIGKQRDNLDDNKMSSMSRTVSSVNLGYSSGSKLNLGLAYSNFTTFTNIRPAFKDINALTPYDNMDTLDYTQLSHTANFNANYNLSANKQRRQALNFNASIQKANDKQGDGNINAGSTFYNLNTSYNYSVTPSNISLTLAFNYNQTENIGFDTKTFGPTVAINKSYMERKLRTTLSTSWNSNYTNGEQNGRILNLRLNGGYQYKNAHSINLSLVVVNRYTKRELEEQRFTEFTGTLGYSYSFSSGKKNKVPEE